ncbi:MAG: NAD(P)H-dependent oxidoreductase subunit E [bacterium]
MADQQTQEVNRILKRYHYDPTDIIAILQDVQQTYRYLPQEVMAHLSERLNIPLTRIYHLSTFFRAFSLEPRGRHHVQVCLGTACHVRGAPRILDAVERKLKISAGQTAPDLSCSLETVNCVGACALGPLVVVDGKSVGKMTGPKAERLMAGLEGDGAGGEKPSAGAAKALAAKPSASEPRPARPEKTAARLKPAGSKPARPARSPVAKVKKVAKKVVQEAAKLSARKAPGTARSRAAGDGRPKKSAADSRSPRRAGK